MSSVLPPRMLRLGRPMMVSEPPPHQIRAGKSSWVGCACSLVIFLVLVFYVFPRLQMSLTPAEGGTAGWLLLGTTDKRTADSVALAKTGFKWDSGAILDDLATGLDVEDVDEEPSESASNSTQEREALESAEDANKKPQETQVLDANITHSKTRLDLLAARKQLDGAPSSSAKVPALLSSDQESAAINASRGSERRSGVRAGRGKRRAGVAASERGKPILNEFSFPANLVQGMRFVLMCQVLDGEPPIQIKWFKDNLDLAALLAQQANEDNQPQQQQPADFGPGAVRLVGGEPSNSSGTNAAAGQQPPMDQVEMISNDELGASLLFRKVKQQHGGNYTCLATNRFGATSYTSLMTVKVPPTWRVEPQDRESIMGEQVTIDCQAAGNPTPFLRWKFAGVQHDKIQSAGQDFPPSPAEFQAGGQQHIFKLINSNHHVQTLENGSLIIRQASGEHEGLYLCEADNGVEPSLVKQIKLIVHKQAHFLDDIQVLVQSAAPPSSSSSSSSAGQQLQQQQHQDLIASSKATKDLALSVQPASQLAPSIKAVSLPQNSSLVRLLCAPLGDVPIQLDWLKDGRLIHTHSSDGLPGGAAPDASGVSPLNERSSVVGRFHVSSRWSPSRSPATSGLASELILANLAWHDAGLYTCAARNAFGHSERKLRLIVQEPPEAPTMVDVARISSRSIALRWLAPADGNSPITKYVIEYRKQPSGSPQGSPGSPPANDNSAPVGRSEKRMPQAENLKSGDADAAPFMGEAAGARQQALGSAAMAADGLIGLTGDRSQIQHTIHDLKPLTAYSMRVIAVNAIGQSRPSVALSLRTEEEVPATMPELVEAVVQSSKSIKLRWTISYSPEHELIDGFFIGYQSFDSSALVESGGGPGAQAGPAKQMLERPTFIYKRICLINQSQQQASELGAGGQAPLESLQDGPTHVLSPISSVTKTVPASSMQTGAASSKFVSAPPLKQQEQPGGEVTLVVISNFEFVIAGLERNSEYTILIQCFNKKGAGPRSEPIVAKTLMHDPPEKLVLSASELTETSLRLSWHFPFETISKGGPQMADFSRLIGKPSSAEPVDGFVLTFAKIGPPRSPSMKGAHHQRARGPTSEQSASQFPTAQASVQQRRQLADQAARISNQFSAQSDNSFQYNPPLAPGQLLDQQWQAVQLASQQREHTLKGLECGTRYAMKIWAFNKVGKGEPSDLVQTSTRGKEPVPPNRPAFLGVNSTQVKLKLDAWFDGGCEIEKFVVQYRARGQSEWILVSNNIQREQAGVIIRDLAPASSYELLVGAQNHVGASEAKYRFTTLDSEGKQVVPSKSFLPILNGRDDGEDPDEASFIDYSDEQSTLNGANVRRESYAGDHHAARWLLVVRHVLNSPLTLLLTFCVFLLLLALLLFHRLSNKTGAGYQATSGGSSSANGPGQSGGKPALNCGQGLIRRCSLDGTATILDGEQPMSCATNGSSSTSADSPSRGQNVHAATLMGRLNGAGGLNPAYGQLDCYNNLANYCAANQSANYGSASQTLLSAESAAQQLANNWSSGADNYATGGQQQQLSGFYSALPPATSSSYAASNAAAQRSSATEPNPARFDQLDGARQQYLMQMVQTNQSFDSGTNNARDADAYHSSMTTAALATMARHKTNAYGSAASGGNHQLLPGAGNFTLGRVPAASHQDAYSDDKSNSGLESYQMNSLDLSWRRHPKASLLISERRQPDSLYRDTSGNLSSSFASTSGRGTGTTSQSGLQDIPESFTDDGAQTLYKRPSDFQSLAQPVKGMFDDGASSDLAAASKAPEKMESNVKLVENNKCDTSSPYEVPFKY